MVGIKPSYKNWSPQSIILNIIASARSSHTISTHGGRVNPVAKIASAANMSSHPPLALLHPSTPSHAHTLVINWIIHIWPTPGNA